ncbi:hypothetical protein R5R35_007435 [Gryllus longicercus]|uniref:Cytochrome P450 n=1 Tax=Gryllus longicercus TaxID=2509291 RepID=A0AAN9VD10_9ORTH
MWELVRSVAAQATVFDWALLGAVALVLLWVAGTWNYDFFARRGVAYSRPRLPFVGNTISGFLGITTFPDMLQEMHDISKGHAIYGWFQNQNPFYLVTDPELLKHIAVKDFDHFTDHREIVKGEPDPIFNKNLFLLKGERWRAMRATLSPAFTTSKIKGIFPLAAKTAEQMAAHLRQEQAKSASGIKSKPLETDMKNLFSRVANDVIGTVAFGIGCDSLKEPENEFYQRGKTLSSFSVKRMVIFFFYLIIPKIMKALDMRVFDPETIKFLDSLVHETIQERQKKGIFRPDMLQLLMQARDGQLRVEEEDKHETEKTGAAKQELTNDDISGQAVIFFFWI